MTLLMKRRSQLIAANQNEYPEGYGNLAFPTAEALAEAEQKRSALLSALAPLVETGCDGSKLDVRNLSRGCQQCTRGGWSCLFINGRCNCSCFYCPTSQNDLSIPTTNTVSFNHPDDYVSYLQRFGFTGASLSGGEPLFTPARCLDFLGAIKRHFGNDMYCWLYTNGTLANKELLEKLRDTGLDEIRFDIGATNYNLTALKQATGIFPTLTVEIPAIPEESERLKMIFRELVDAGVTHLNLHQLRLTPHNFANLQNRGYSFLHGEKITVLESELTALELVLYGAQHVPELNINYCSSIYKNRFQNRAARRRNAIFTVKPYESVTPNGYIRTLCLIGESSRLETVVQTLLPHDISNALWSLQRSGKSMYIHENLLSLLDLGNITLRVSYWSAHQRNAVSYQNPFVSVELSSRQKIIIEKSRTCADIDLDQEQALLFTMAYCNPTATTQDLPETDLWDTIGNFEHPPAGMQEYF